MTAALFPLPGCVPRPSPPTDAKTLRDGGTAPTKMSLLSLTNGRLFPSRKPEVSKRAVEYLQIPTMLSEARVCRRRAVIRTQSLTHINSTRFLC